MIAIGIDIGGTSIKGAGITKEGKVLDVFSMPVDKADTQEATINKLINAVNVYVKDQGFKKEEILGIGCGVPGVMDTKTGIVTYSNNLRWFDLPIVEMLEKPTFRIIPRKGQYILLDHFSTTWVKHTLFMCPTKVGKGVLISPTTSFNYIVGPSNTSCELDDTATDVETFNYLKDTAKKLIPNIPYLNTIREFAGIRANNDIDDFIIKESDVNKGFIIVGGIMSPGLASSPAIGEYVSNLVKDILHLDVNEKFNPYVRPHYKLSNMEQINSKIKEDPSFGKIVCRCEKVSEGQIVDAIRRNCGARTVKGVKKRTRSGFGKCQGTFCQAEVVKILARELNISQQEVCYSELGTNILKYEAKGEK